MVIIHEALYEFPFANSQTKLTKNDLEYCQLTSTL